MDQIEAFSFHGKLPSSKSIFNRCLIVKSFYPEFDVEGHSSCNDVEKMQQALHGLLKGEHSFDCGSAGTTFRFLLSRLSREKGSWKLKCEKRLLERPHAPLFEALNQLGVKVERPSSEEILISSEGWQIKQSIFLDLDQSSQFVSALLLSAWNLNEPLHIQLGDSKNSLSYLNLTIEILRELGMQIDQNDNEVTVPAYQKLKTFKYRIESDMSSAFALSCHALVSGKLLLTDFPNRSLQPDFIFVELLKKMNAKIEINSDKKTEGREALFELKVTESKNLCPVRVDLTSQPDLFPVLAILLSRIEGESVIEGLKLLQFKESDRLQNTIKFMNQLGIKTKLTDDQLVVFGKRNHEYPNHFEFDPDQDHRMAMAASLSIFQGAKIHILNKSVVDKSFPEFWDIVKI